MSNRYDSAEYLAAFRDRRAYPSIHDALFGLVMDVSRESRFLDLCCGTGLLGERTLRQAGADFVLGVDASRSSIDLARSHGVSIPIERLEVGPATLASLGGLIVTHRLEAVLARRCLPELVGDRPGLERDLAATLADSGIREVFLQGRVVGARSTNRLACVDREVASLASRFKPSARRGPCVLLVRR